MKYGANDLIELHDPYDGNFIKYQWLLDKIAVALFVEASTRHQKLSFESIEALLGLAEGFIDNDVAKDAICKLDINFPYTSLEHRIVDNNFEITVSTTRHSSNPSEYDLQLSKIATTLFVTTSKETTTNSWCNYFSEVEKICNLPDGFIDDKVADDVIDQLYADFPLAILYCEVTEDNGDKYFDVTLGDAFCVGYVDYDTCFENSDEWE